MTESRFCTRKDKNCTGIFLYVFHVIMCVNCWLIITSFSRVLMSESVPEGARFFLNSHVSSV